MGRAANVDEGMQRSDQGVESKKSLIRARDWEMCGGYAVTIT
jgi:hypothetical protein